MTRADLFSIEAARGAAQVVLVSKPHLVPSSQGHDADESFPEYLHAMSPVLAYNPRIRSAEHWFNRPVDRCWCAVWPGRSSNGLDHQAGLLGAS